MNQRFVTRHCIPYTIVLAVVLLLASLTNANQQNCATGIIYSPSIDPQSGYCGFARIPNFQVNFDLQYSLAYSMIGIDTEVFCGECYQLTGPYPALPGAKPVIVMVADSCPFCSSNDLDVATKAYQALAEGASDGPPLLVEYQKVACPFNAQNSSVSIHVTPGSYEYYLSIRPYQHAIAIDIPMIKQNSSDSFVSMKDERNYFQFSFSSLEPINFPVTIRLTARATKETIDIEIPSMPASDSVYHSNQQFAYTLPDHNSKTCDYPAESTIYSEGDFYSVELVIPGELGHKR